MANLIDNTILLKTRPVVLNKEKAAAATITPGDFVELTSSDTYQRQSTLGADDAKLIAIEYDLQAGSIDDDYSATDNVLTASLLPGDEVNTFVAASAAAIVIGDKVEFDATGGVKILAAGTVIGTALEAVDNSGGGSKARIKIEIK